MKLEELEKVLNVFKSNLNKLSNGRFRSKEQENALKNIKVPQESREVVIKLFNDYSSNASEGKYRTKFGDGLKILTPKQMLQRLPIALAQVKAANKFKNLLNKIRQDIYFSHRSKEIAKKTI